MSRFLKPLGCVGMSALGLLILPAAARASTVTFNFDTCGNGTTKNASCGSSTTYNVDGFSITATAFGTNANLFAKQDGSDENGLGLTNDHSGQNEITAGSFIQLNVSDITGNDPLTIIMNSSTGSDAWKIYESNTGGATSGTTLATGTNEATFTVSPGDTFVDVTATDGNVLLSSLSFETSTPPVPEPGSLALLGTSILGLAGVVRRKLKG